MTSACTPSRSMSFARSAGVVGRAMPFRPSSYRPVDAITSTRWCLPGSYLEPAGPTPPHRPKLVPFFAADAATEALLVIGEIGGNEEEELAAALTDCRFAKPVFALIAGRSSPEGVTMGHAGALVHGSHGAYADKKAALEQGGVTVCGSLDEATSRVATWHAARPRL